MAERKWGETLCVKQGGMIKLGMEHMEKFGKCNICGNIGPLTEDHVPPQGCTRPTKVFVRNLAQKLHGQQGKYLGKGIKFKTICSKCNNALLGSKYDQAFVNFCNSVISIVQVGRNLYLPNIFVSIQPVKIVKAIAGHMLASVDSTNQNARLDSPYWEFLRKVVQNEDEPIPDNLGIFYWLYPYDCQTVIPFFTYISTKNTKYGLKGGILKFFPLAFWLIWDRPKEIKVPGILLPATPKMKIDEEISTKIDLFFVPRLNWPEDPDTNGIVFFAGELAKFADKATKRKKAKNSKL